MRDEQSNDSRPKAVAKEMRALRRNPSLPASIWSGITQALSAVISSGALLFTSEKRHQMCKNYGHVVADKSWTGPFPKCGDCGVIIKDPSMLRTSLGNHRLLDQGVQSRRNVNGRLI